MNTLNDLEGKTEKGFGGLTVCIRCPWMSNLNIYFGFDKQVVLTKPLTMLTRKQYC